MNKMIDIKKDAIEYFDHNPHSEGVVFIMIDKSMCIFDNAYGDNEGDCYELKDDVLTEFSICSRIDNENCITREEQITQSIDNSVSAWRKGDTSLDDLFETLKAI